MPPKLIHLSYKIVPSPVRQTDVWKIYAAFNSRFPNLNVTDFKIKRGIYYGQETFLNQLELGILSDHASSTDLLNSLKVDIDLSEFSLSPITSK